MEEHIRRRSSSEPAGKPREITVRRGFSTMGFNTLLAIVLLLLLMAERICGQLLDDDSMQNSVVGDPYVNCAADAIYVKLKTNRTFEGHVHLKFVSNKKCYQVLVTNNQIEVLIPHEECAVMRKRLKSPPGVSLEASLAVSFHPEFTTADDRIFHFRCFHQRNSSKDVQSTGSPTEPPQDSSRFPVCSYTVRMWMDGPLVGTVFLGQTVFHQWSCENEQDNCLIVRSCSVVGSETKHSLMDEDGCSKDTKILPNLDYISPSMVGQNVSVFGISQTSLIYFECELILIPKTDGQCEIPQCSETANRTRRSFEASEEHAFEVQSQRIEVSELGMMPNADDQVVRPVELTCPDKPTPPRRNQICVAFNPFIIFLGGMIAMAVFAAFVAVTISLQRYRHYSISHTAC
ncbi:ZP domain-containing protein [Trichostrongylus colubriformis]|uniref:ZP domain-containing protein n=1 Tax=Trichostrongylus colubriformis TaxID=6319 RepID=A0AAN8F103_TRICO